MDAVKFFNYFWCSKIAYMTIPDKAQLAANEGLKKYIASDEFIAVTTGNIAVIAKSVLFTTNSDKAVASAAAAYISNAGFSQEKLDAKENLAFTVSYLAGNAQVKLDELNLQSISMQLHDSETYYSHAADAECASSAQAACTLMTLKQTIITDDFVTLTELTALQALITSFLSIQGTSEEMHTVSPQLTKQFKDDIKLTKKNAKDLIKLSKRYKNSNSGYYNSLVDLAKPKIAVHHTDVEIFVYNIATGEAINLAVASFSNSKKTGTSTSDGMLSVDEIRAGNPMLTIKAPEYNDYLGMIHIVSGTTNSFRIGLTHK